ncbi:MAG: Mrp/NBP35 family ATP-binding protein [Erysipelotrichaceae bacterium]
MGNCNSCASKASCGKTPETCGVERSKHNEKIKRVYGVMSGKGGVGKSSMTVLLARQLQKEGYRVGILDADITGPSIPRLLALESEAAYGSEDGILPIEDANGIKMMSINAMISDENMPVLWRGAMITKIIKQFWNEVIWGELDVLLIDMPPGTGDVALTIMQSIPLNGVLMVSLPQDMVSMIVAKAINMCRQMNVEVIGLIENMSYVLCPDCKTRIDIYDQSTIQPFLEAQNIPLLAELPTVQSISQLYKADTLSLAVQEHMESLIKPVSDHLISLQS